MGKHNKKSKDVPGIYEGGKIVAKIGTKVSIPLNLIRPNPDQPRKIFKEKSLHEMAGSIFERGDVVNAIIVEIRDDGRCVEIVDGERRWRASKIAGIKKMSCIIQEPEKEDDLFVTSTLSNLCREDMNPIDQANVIKKIMDKKGWNVPTIASKLGKSMGWVYQLLNYLKLNPSVREKLSGGEIGAGIAQQLTGYNEKDQPRMLAVIEKAQKRNGGRPIHPNEATRIMRKEADRRNIKPTQGSRGVQKKSHAELTSGRIVLLMRDLEEMLGEFNAIKADALRAMKEPHHIDVERGLTSLGRLTRIAEKKLSELD